MSAVNVYFVCFILFSTCISRDSGCGVDTHIEIAYRALAYFAGTTSSHNFTELIWKHQDAFQAGSPYPDAFYGTLCQHGLYNNVSEDTHWGGFLNASINFIREKHPQPWDVETEKLVVFLLGIVSHQVADVSWHSLGIEQGFIRAMSKVNYHNDYDNAHTAADIGGDIVNQYELDMDYIKLLHQWYVPSEDLHQIYKMFYGSERMPRQVIESCSAILLLERLGEKLAIGKLFPYSASGSPFLVDMLNPYFLGGIDDMAAWTRYIWKDFIHMLEHGVQSCDLPHNALFTHCNNSSEHPKLQKTFRGKERNGYFKEPNLNGFVVDDIEKRYTKRGTYLKFPSRLQKMAKRQNLQKGAKRRNEENEVLKDSGWKLRTPRAKSEQFPIYTFTTSYPYARLGWSIITKDVNGDGHTDVILGAPGAGKAGHVTGMVFVVLGDGNGFVTENMVVDKMANLTIVGPSKNGRFGHAVDLLDMNSDGLIDLIVGAPGVGSENLTYNGSVYIYFGTGSPSQPFNVQPNVTLIGKRTYLGVGWSLGVLNKLLLMGAPFASINGGEQNGAVFAISGNKLKGGVYHLGDANLWLSSSQNYSWFGYNMQTKEDDLLLISSPTHRKCALPNCSFDANDTEAIGKVDVYSVDSTKASLLRSVLGLHRFDMFGASSAVSNGGKLLAISAAGASIKGTVDNVSLPLDQVGSVLLYNLSSLLSETPQKPLSQYYGDRMFGRFGQIVLFEDVNDDSHDDLVVSSPLRTENILDDFGKVEVGGIFVFLSKNGSFPQGNVTLHCGPDSSVVPCTSTVADIFLTTEENQGRLGTTMSIATFSSKKYLVAGSPHSNRGARLSGAVSIYCLR